MPSSQVPLGMPSSSRGVSVFRTCGLVLLPSPPEGADSRSAAAAAAAPAAPALALAAPISSSAMTLPAPVVPETCLRVSVDFCTGGSTNSLARSRARSTDARARSTMTSERGGLWLARREASMLITLPGAALSRNSGWFEWAEVSELPGIEPPAAEESAASRDAPSPPTFDDCLPKNGMRKC